MIKLHPLLSTACQVGEYRLKELIKMAYPKESEQKRKEIHFLCSNHDNELPEPLEDLSYEILRKAGVIKR